MKTGGIPNQPYSPQSLPAKQSIQGSSGPHTAQASEKAKSIEKGFSRLATDIKRLEQLRVGKDPVAYQKALDQASDEFNQMLVIAKADGGASGQEVQSILKKVSQTLVSGQTGLNLNMDGNLVVNEGVAKGAFAAPSVKAMAAFSEATDILKSGNQASSTQQMVYADDAVRHLSKTYDANGGVSVYSGPSQIYELS